MILNMRRFCINLSIVLVIGISLPAKAQTPRTLSSAEIFAGIQRLKVLGSVLYVAAHPDDENTRLLACLARERHLRTGYLSLTRGDGGQNLIGDEQGIELGLIRTQELLAARRIDGAEQFFTRAFDFGFSKSTDEALRTWGREKILRRCSDRRRQGASADLPALGARHGWHRAEEDHADPQEHQRDQAG